MQANEFVKTHGLESTKDIVKHYGNHTHITDDARMFITEEFYKETRANYVDDLNSMVKMEDLKRLVESHELVQSKGGIEKAKAIVADSFIWGLGGRVYANPLEQAIADVESCQ